MRVVHVSAPAADATPTASGSTSTAGQGSVPDAELLKIARAVNKAKRVAVLCGAGISTSAQIPDFRSSTGLFASLKAQHPKAGLSSGKDLFSASLYQNEASTALFYSMIAELKTMSDAAEPTAFHRFLKQLDDAGKLFRVYTQNIDGLEEKVGLSYGLDELDPALIPGTPSRIRKRKRESDAASNTTESEPTSTAMSASTSASDDAPVPANPVASTSMTTPVAQRTADLLRTPTKPRTPQPPTSSARRRKPPVEACRVIPLHGTMQYLTCTKCAHREPLVDHVETLRAGQAVGCSECMVEKRERELSRSRSRGIGLMKVGVVLYGEEHAHAARVGEITRRDLFGPRPDLLIVAGTSLKVPGTKRLVRELAKVTRPAEPPADAVHTLFLNFDLPAPATAWRDVFDVAVQGDIDAFIGAVQAQAGVDEAAKAVKADRRKSATTTPKKPAAPIAEMRPPAPVQTPVARPVSPARPPSGHARSVPSSPKAPRWTYVSPDDFEAYMAKPEPILPTRTRSGSQSIRDTLAPAPPPCPSASVTQLTPPRAVAEPSFLNQPQRMTAFMPVAKPGKPLSKPQPLRSSPP